MHGQVHGQVHREYATGLNGPCHAAIAIQSSIYCRCCVMRDVQTVSCKLDKVSVTGV